MWPVSFTTGVRWSCSLQLISYAQPKHKLKKRRSVFSSPLNRSKPSLHLHRRTFKRLPLQMANMNDKVPPSCLDVVRFCCVFLPFCSVRFCSFCCVFLVCSVRLCVAVLCLCCSNMSFCFCCAVFCSTVLFEWVRFCCAVFGCAVWVVRLSCVCALHQLYDS